VTLVPNDPDSLHRGAIPFRKSGETFGQYWSKLTPERVARLHVAMRWIGVTTPRGLWESYIPFDESLRDGLAAEKEDGPGSS
jgi:hypothetical protein